MNILKGDPDQVVKGAESSESDKFNSEKQPTKLVAQKKFLCYFLGDFIFFFVFRGFRSVVMVGGLLRRSATHFSLYY